jgi:hypothetical protein
MSDNAPVGLAISDDLAEKINHALVNSLPMVVAYVNGSNQARLSFRGSTQVHSADQLAIWVRDPEGGLLGAIPSNPNLTLMYRDPATRTTIFFYGRGHVADDSATRDNVYTSSPEQEQKADPDKKGKALIVDLDLIQGRTPEGPLNLTRAS